MSRSRRSRSARRHPTMVAGAVSAGAVLAAAGLVAPADAAQAADAAGPLSSSSSSALRDTELVKGKDATTVGGSVLRHIGSGTVLEVVRGPHGGHLVTVQRSDGAVVTVVQDATQVSRSVRVDMPS